MFPPADDPPDLGIPPNRGPLPVRRNPNSKPNPRGSHPTAALCPSGQTLAFVPAINAMPGRRDSGARAHRGALCEILDLRSEMRIGVRRPRLALVSFCFENGECLRERILLLWVLHLGIELLGFETVLDLCGLILI
ncbi:hypothetical protein AAG906_014278 [Vitis piasezkii]